MQFKKILAYALTVCLLLSLTVPAHAVDDVYSVSDDTAALSVPIYYTADYYPGVVSEMRSSGLYANTIAHGSYSEMNYNPSWFSMKGSSITSGDFNTITPEVLADQSDVSAVYSIPNTSFLNGDSLTFNLPNTEDGYFDFQSSNFLFDQQSAQANTFYVNGTLTFNLRNLWSFTGYDADVNAKNASWYLASDPLAVQLVIDGKAYGDIIDVTGYTSPFTALYNGGIPTNASVTFDNLKVYYQGDTPDMIGFRVYTGSKFTNGSYNYGSYTAVAVTNTVTFRVSEIPDITFVQEGGDSYAGDLSGIQSSLSSLLTAINNGFASLRSLFVDSSGVSLIARLYDGSLLQQGLSYLNAAGGVSAAPGSVSLALQLSQAFQGLRTFFVRPVGYAVLDMTGHVVQAAADTPLHSLIANSFIALDYDLTYYPGWKMLTSAGTWSDIAEALPISYVLGQGFGGIATLLRNSQSYVADTVFPWQSYNMETHQLNAATNITGQNNLFFTAFQSIEDKLGRLAYVFGSDEDLALKDDADPGTDAFRENFGGGLSLGQISDGADVVAGVNGLFDSGYSFGDAFTEIAGEDGFLLWFSADTAAALDATGSLMTLDDSDPYNMQIYYDQVQKVKEKREAGDD